jgi:hypothetical protein
MNTSPREARVTQSLGRWRNESLSMNCSMGPNATSWAGCLQAKTVYLSVYFVHRADIEARRTAVPKIWTTRADLPVLSQPAPATDEWQMAAMVGYTSRVTLRRICSLPVDQQEDRSTQVDNSFSGTAM